MTQSGSQNLTANGADLSGITVGSSAGSVTQSLALGSAADGAGLGSGAGSICPGVTQSSIQFSAADGAGLSVHAVGSSAGGVTQSITLGQTAGGAGLGSGAGGSVPVVLGGDGNVIEGIETLIGAIVQEVDDSGLRLSGEGDVNIIPSAHLGAHVDAGGVVVILSRTQSGIHRPGGESRGELHPESRVAIGSGTAVHLEGQDVLVVNHQIGSRLAEHMSAAGQLVGGDHVALTGTGIVSSDLGVGGVQPLQSAGLEVTVLQIAVVLHAAVQGSNVEVIEVHGGVGPLRLGTQPNLVVVAGVEHKRIGLPSGVGRLDLLAQREGKGAAQPVVLSDDDLDRPVSAGVQSIERKDVIGVGLNRDAGAVADVGIHTLGDGVLHHVVTVLGLGCRGITGGDNLERSVSVAGSPGVIGLKVLEIDGVIGDLGSRGSDVLGNLDIIQPNLSSALRLQQENDTFLGGGEMIGIGSPLSGESGDKVGCNITGPGAVVEHEFQVHSLGGLSLNRQDVLGAHNAIKGLVQVFPTASGPMQNTVLNDDSVICVNREHHLAIIKVGTENAGGADRQGGHGDGGAQHQNSGHNGNDLFHTCFPPKINIRVLRLRQEKKMVYSEIRTVYEPPRLPLQFAVIEGLAAL